MDCDSNRSCAVVVDDATRASVPTYGFGPRQVGLHSCNCKRSTILRGLDYGSLNNADSVRRSVSVLVNGIWGS